jgi:outer membrane protein assembly factor BamD (BamD/ComL family)
VTGRRRLILAGACLIAIVGSAGALAQSAEETVARGRLESGRNFARQGNYEEALADFRAVAESHATTSVADDALLEIARYYFDIAGDMDQAEAAVQAIITSYPTSDSAPAAFVMAGRLAMGRGRDAEHLNAALAHFERLVTVFPTSTAVPAALALAGEAHYYAGRLDEALASLSRVTAEYPADPAAAEAYLFSGQVLLAMSDPILAMEELQQVRNRWPDLPAADAALARITLLHRLYVRGANGAAYVPVPETVGPARLENVRAVVATAAGAVYAVSERGVAIGWSWSTAGPCCIRRAARR